MIHGPLYSGMIIVGCVIGLAFGYLSMRDSLKDVAATNVPTGIAMPSVLTQEGVVRYIDVQNNAIILDVIQPHDPKSRIAIQATYSENTSFLNQFGKAIMLSEFSVNDRVGVAIARKVGIFQLVRVNKL